MATSTQNINLTMPGTGELANISDINGNMEKIDTAFGNECLVLLATGVTALPHSITNSKISAQHQVMFSVLSNPAAMSGTEWEYTTSTGGITITGTISGSTDIRMFLAKIF